MPSTFSPRLVNGPFGDPALFAPCSLDNRALLFDMGDLSNLSPRDLLKISHVFVTHAHMDHLIGFDRLLRLLLGRAKTLSLFGPEGFLGHIQGKLTGYAWNLAETFIHPLVFSVSEVTPSTIKTRNFSLSKRFRPDRLKTRPFNGILVEDSCFTVTAAILDHRIPCLGFGMEEPFQINILETALDTLGLQHGAWLKRFKKMLYEEAPPGSILEAPAVHDPPGKIRFRLDELASRICRITPGRKIAYIADAAFHPPNIDKIQTIARSCDHLFIEAAFAEEHRDEAARKNHLTAAQAGRIAAWTSAGRYTLFHFSPRYTDCPEKLIEEARVAHEQAVRSSEAFHSTLEFE